MPAQAAVAIKATVPTGSMADLTATLAGVEPDAVAPLMSSIGGVHFARLLVVPGASDVGGADLPDSLTYLAEIDGAASAHLRALSDRGGALLDSVFSLCEGYPRSPDPAARYAWLCTHTVDSAASYTNTIGLGVQQVRQESLLYERLQVFLDDHDDELRLLSPREVHRRVRAYSGQDPALLFALVPADPLPVGHRVKAALTVLLTGTAVVVTLPVTVAVGVPWLLALRRRERSDPVDATRPSAESVQRLRAQEDHVAYNSFAAVGIVKPGALRRRTMEVVLAAISFGVQHVFHRGSLAGVTTIHFARWVALDDKRRVIFTSYYDGSLESYMDDFIDKLSWGLNLVFSNGLGYPRTRWLVLGGARDEQSFKDYLRCHQLSTAVCYSAYDSLTTANITNNAAVRAGLARELTDAQAHDWLARL